MPTRGRKPIEIDPKTVQTLAAQGLTDEKIYAFLGISHDTFYKRKREYTEFSEALSKGRANGEAALANKLYNKAMAGTGNSEDIKYILERRFGWGKVDKIQVGGKIEQEHEHHHDMEIGPALREVLDSLGIPAESGRPMVGNEGDSKA